MVFDAPGNQLLVWDDVAEHAQGVHRVGRDEPRWLQEAEAATPGHHDGEKSPEDSDCCRHRRRVIVSSLFGNGGT